MGFEASLISFMRRSSLVIGLPVLALVACDQPPAEQAQEYMKSAQQHYESGNLKAAAVELKNALQIDGRNAGARLLLGKLYIDFGEGANAEKELLRARELGADGPSERLLVGQAHLLQSEYQEALAELPEEPTGDTKVDADLQAARGRAFLGLRRYEDARAAFERSLTLAPNPTAHEGLALIAMFENDYEAAARQIEAGLTIDPQDASLLVLDAERSFRQGQLESAAEKFAAVLDVSPNNLSARLRLARVYAEQKKYGEARSQLSALLAQSPNSLDATLLLGSIAFEERNYEEALRQATVVLRGDDSNLTALYLAGASSLALNQLEKAHSYLTRVTHSAPASDVARRLLAATQMRLGQGGAAIESLAQSGTVLEDASDLQALTETAIRSGKLQEGLRYLEGLAGAGEGNADLHVQIGLLKIAMGDVEAGGGELAIAQTLDPEIRTDQSYSQAQVMIIETYLRTGQLEKALEEANKLQESNPQAPEGFLYAGVALMSMNQPEEGERAFLKALQVLPGYPQASLGLAELEARRGAFPKANDYLEASLAQFPNDLRVILRLASLAERQGRNDEMKRWLERAVSTNPEAIEPRLSLNRFLMSQQQFDAALAIMDPLLPANERNPIVLKYVGQSQAFAGKHREAADTFKKWVELMPNSPQPYLALADVYEMSGESAAFRQSLEKAVSLDKKNVPVLFRLGRLQIATNDASGARATVADLMQVAAESAEVKELEAGIALLEKNPRQAAELFREARQVSDNSRLVRGQAAAEWEAQEPQVAVATLETWIKSNPEDVDARFAVNRYYYELGEVDKSQANLRAILTFQPRNWVAHNNLAESMAAEGQTAAALEHAETAYRLAPDNASVMDTLGVILHTAGDSARAVTLLRQAAQGLPDVPDVGFHLAQVLADTGKAGEARQVLDQVLASKQAFAARAEAEELRRKLGD